MRKKIILLSIIINSSILLNNELNSQSTLHFNMDVLNSHKEWVNLDSIIQNKFTYIDIWASWCKPCVKSIPSSLKLRNEIKNEKFQIIFLAYKDNYDDWISYSDKLDLHYTQNNYLISQDKIEFFKELLELKYIPRYILLGPNHEILEWKAYSAGNPTFKSQLMNYLNQDK